MDAKRTLVQVIISVDETDEESIKKALEDKGISVYEITRIIFIKQK